MVTSGGLSKNYVILNNLDFSSQTYTSSVIGGTFTGNISGMGFDLSGVKIENTSDNTGLFHTLNNASIENINLIDFVITGRSIIGSLASTVNGHTNIKSVYIINSEIFSTLSRVGGYFGFVDTANLRLIDSDIVVNISGSSSRIGGIMGEA